MTNPRRCIQCGYTPADVCLDCFESRMERLQEQVESLKEELQLMSQPKPTLMRRLVDWMWSFCP